jgi:hypothetical protein
MLHAQLGDDRAQATFEVRGCRVRCHVDLRFWVQYRTSSPRPLRRLEATLMRGRPQKKRPRTMSAGAFSCRMGTSLSQREASILQRYG